MKKLTAWVLSLCILFGLTACGRQTEEPAATSDTSGSGISQPAEEESQSSAAAEENTQIAQETGQENILIAYFSWVDNTVVEDEEAAVQSALAHYESIGDRENYSDVDAVASASVVAPGNTAHMAQWIRSMWEENCFPSL